MWAAIPDGRTNAFYDSHRRTRDFQPIKIKWNGHEGPPPVIDHMPRGNVVGEGAALKQDLAFASVELLRHDRRIASGAR